MTSRALPKPHYTTIADLVLVLLLLSLLLLGQLLATAETQGLHQNKELSTQTDYFEEYLHLGQ